MTPSEQLRERVLAAARAAPAPTRAAAAKRDLVAFSLAFGLAFLVFWLEGGVRVAPRPPSLVAATVIGSALLALGAVWLAGTRGGSMLGRPAALVLAVAAGVPLLFLAWKLVWSAQFEGMTVRWPDRVGLRCLALSLATGVGPFVAFLIARRGSDPRNPAVSGAGVGIASGAVAAVLVDLWCPVAYLPHLLLGHVLPMVAFTVAGALVGRWLLRVGR